MSSCAAPPTRALPTAGTSCFARAARTTARPVEPGPARAWRVWADGELGEGATWRQESIVGSVFEGFVTVEDGKIYPHITGFAHVNAEAALILDERDPFCYGIRSSCAPATT